MTRFSMSYAHSGAAAAIFCTAIFCAGGCGHGGSDPFESAKAAFEAGDFEKASKTVAAGLESGAVEPGADALMILARSRLALGDVSGAADAVARAAEAAPSDWDVKDLSAQISYHAKDYGGAIAIYKTMAADRKAPGEVRSRGYCGMAAVEMSMPPADGGDDRRDLARVFLLSAIRLDARNAAARYHLGRLYRDRFGFPESALDQFEVFVRLDAPDDRVEKVRSRTIPDLRDAISKALSRRPGASRRDGAACAAALSKADEAWKQSKFKTACLRYREAHAADVLSFQAAIGLARSCEKSDPSSSGQSEALKYYKTAAGLRPSSHETLVKTGALAMKLRQYPVAAEAFSRALAARPNDASTAASLAQALEKCGNAKSASIYRKYGEGLASSAR